MFVFMDEINIETVKKTEEYKIEYREKTGREKPDSSVLAAPQYVLYVFADKGKKWIIDAAQIRRWGKGVNRIDDSETPNMLKVFAKGYLEDNSQKGGFEAVVDEYGGNMEEINVEAVPDPGYSNKSSF